MAPVRISFCRGCLSKWLETNAAKSCPLRCASRIERLVPNRFAACIIGALELRCPAAAEPDAPPCAWVGPLRDLPAHCDTCVAQLVPCTNAGCGKRVPAGVLGAHLAACGLEAAEAPAEAGRATPTQAAGSGGAAGATEANAGAAVGGDQQLPLPGAMRCGHCVSCANPRLRQACFLRRVAEGGLLPSGSGMQARQPVHAPGVARARPAAAEEEPAPQQRRMA